MHKREIPQTIRKCGCDCKRLHETGGWRARKVLGQAALSCLFLWKTLTSLLHLQYSVWKTAGVNGKETDAAQTVFSMVLVEEAQLG